MAKKTYLIQDTIDTILYSDRRLLHAHALCTQIAHICLDHSTRIISNPISALLQIP